MIRLRSLLLALAASACTTTTTEFVFCATVETYPPGVARELADSVRIDDCDDESLNGTVVRRVP